MGASQQASSQSGGEKRVRCFLSLSLSLSLTLIHLANNPASAPPQQNRAEDSLRPVTIKQLVECKEPYPNAELSIDGLPTSQVTLVGQVRTVNKQTINTTYRIDDGTGVIDVKNWIDPEKGESHPSFAVDTYVRIYGRLQSYNGKRTVSAHQMRAIQDFNEVNYHLLEATYVHLQLTKGAPGAGAGHGGGDSMDTGGDGMFVDGGDSGRAQLSSCSRNARTFYTFVSNAPGGDGQHLSQIATGTKMSARDIMAAAEELLNLGLIYTTEDDETWNVMDA